MPFPYLHETQELNNETRKRTKSGAFVRLSAGVTHYELRSPLQMYSSAKRPVRVGEGPGVGFRTIVLVHGFSVPYFIFDPTFKFLTETRFLYNPRSEVEMGGETWFLKSGFRVLRYDLFGRGLSDRPRLRYDIHLFVRQLKDLLDALGITEPVHLAGLSMGGPISAAFVEQYPERVKTHILIDPAGAAPIPTSGVARLVRLPLLGELILGLFGSRNMVKSLASDFYSPELVAQFQAKYSLQMKYKGYMRAILSTLRSGMLDSFYETYQRVGKLKKPTLLFWGRNDATVPFEQSALLTKAIPHAEFHIIENCGHIPHYEKPEEVNPILSEFIIDSTAKTFFNREERTPALAGGAREEREENSNAF